MAAAPFFTLIPLVNLPFDWASIGLTRWLLRAGAEPGSGVWRPLVFGFADFAVAALLVVPALACATVLAIHVVNAGTVIAGAPAPLPLGEILTSLRQEPTHPRNYWMYFTLLSTLLPSILNLFVGAASAFSWATVGCWALAPIEKYRADPKGQSAMLGWLPGWLAAPWMLGVFFTAVALYWLFQFFLWAPFIGLPALLRLIESFAALSEPWITALVDTIARAIQAL